MTNLGEYALPAPAQPSHDYFVHTMSSDMSQNSCFRAVLSLCLNVCLELWVAMYWHMLKALLGKIYNLVFGELAFMEQDSVLGCVSCWA